MRQRHLIGIFTAILAMLPWLEVAAQEASASLPAELGWVKFRICGGRLQIASPRYRESRTFESSNPLAGTSETLRLNISAESSSINYRQRSPRQEVTIVFESPDVVTVERLPGEEAGDDPVATVKFSQTQDGRVTLLIDEGDSQRREHNAPSFWHLMLLARSDAEEHLLPLLTTLRPGWPIAETADGLDDALVKLAGRSVRPQRERWEQWVEELGSPSFQTRRRAERMLREAGPAVVSYLTTLSNDSLDAERKARVDRLLDALSTSADDTPDRIAMWLVDDPLVWTAVAESEASEYRLAAKNQLEHLLRREVDYDPDGKQELRASQLQAIRAKLPRG